MKNPVLAAMEQKLSQHYMDEIKKKKLNMVLDPIDLESERGSRNPVEINYEILEVIGMNSKGNSIVKKVKHKH